MGAVYFSRCPIAGTRCAAGHGGGRLQIEKMRAFIIRVLFYCIILGLAYAVLKYALPFLMPFLVAFLIAFILKPVINWVTQKQSLGASPFRFAAHCVLCSGGRSLRCWVRGL